MQTLVVFGVGLGNLGRHARERVKGDRWISQLNRALATQSPPTHILTTFRHTGNFVIRSAGHPDVVLEQLTKALNARCVIVQLFELEQINNAICNLPARTAPPGFRYTPGAALLVLGNAYGQIPESTPLGNYVGFSSTIVLVLKKDPVTAEGILDRKRRFGGWGAIAAEVGSFLGGKWTARSYSTLSGTLRKANIIINQYSKIN